MHRTPLLIALAVVLGADGPAGPPEARMPDPVETFNLFSYFLRSGAADGAIAMTYGKGIGDRDGLKARYEKFHEMWTASRQSLIALGQDGGKRMALVHVWDHAPNKTVVDIDPGFLIEEDGAWKVLPIFSTPRRKIPYLSEEENSELERLHTAFQKAAPGLKKEYTKARGADAAKEK